MNQSIKLTEVMRDKIVKARVNLDFQHHLTVTSPTEENYRILKIIFSEYKKIFFEFKHNFAEGFFDEDLEKSKTSIDAVKQVMNFAEKDIQRYEKENNL